MANGEVAVYKEALVSVIENKDLDSVIKPLSQEIHLFDSYIAGTIHLKDKTVLQTLQIGDKLALQREDSKFDSHAIMVLNAEKKKLGYVPEKDNIVFARLMDAGKLLIARIKKIEQTGTFKQIGIGIYLVDF